MIGESIWPKKIEWSSLFGNSELQSFFEGEEKPRLFFIPGKRPNEINEYEWKKMTDENPILLNQDIPIAVSKQGEIVCLESKETAYKIGLVGITQYGKSLTMWALADIFYWLKGYKCFFGNEGLSICYDHIYSNNIPFFKKKIDMLGLEPKSLPLVFCYPSTEDTVLPGIYPEFITSIPFIEYLRDPDQFTDLSKSKKYMVKIKEDLLNCKTFEDIENLLEFADMPKASKESILSSINELAKYKIFNLDDNGHSYFILRNTSLRAKSSFEIKQHPIIALLKSNLIPCLITSKLAGNPYETQIFNYYLKMIWHSKEKNGILRDDPIMLFIDELNQVQGNNKDILIKIAREGGNMGQGGISLVWCAQNYTDVFKVIRTNTTISLIFRQADEEANAIQKEFSLPHYWKEKIKTLDKFECLLVTKERFKLYNPESGKFYYTKEPILAEAFPSLSLHRQELSLDSYISEHRRNTKIHERIKRIGGWVLIDKNNKPLFDQRKISKGNTSERFNETLYKLNTHPLTFWEGENLKEMYFSGKTQKHEELTFTELQRKGLNIISYPAKLLIDGSTQIRVMYFFWPINKSIPEGARILPSCPDISIIYDNDKNAVRMYGQNCGSIKTGKLNGVSDWFYLDALKE